MLSMRKIFDKPKLKKLFASQLRIDLILTISIKSLTSKLLVF